MTKQTFVYDELIKCYKCKRYITGMLKRDGAIFYRCHYSDHGPVYISEAAIDKAIIDAMCKIDLGADLETLLSSARELTKATGEMISPGLILELQKRFSELYKAAFPAEKKFLFNHTIKTCYLYDMPDVHVRFELKGTTDDKLSPASGLKEKA